MNPPHPIYRWFMTVIAMAFDTNDLDIGHDPRFRILRDAVIGNQFGSAERDGVTVIFNPVLQVIRFDCRLESTAIELIEILQRHGARCKHLVVIPVPNRFFDRVDGSLLLPKPTDMISGDS